MYQKANRMVMRYVSSYHDKALIMIWYESKKKLNESSFIMSASATPIPKASFLLGALSELIEVTNSVKVCFG